MGFSRHNRFSYLLLHAITLTFLLAASGSNTALAASKPRLPTFEEIQRSRRAGQPEIDKAVYFTHHTNDQEWRDIEAWAISKGLTHAGAVWNDPNFVDTDRYDTSDWYDMYRFWQDFSRVYAQNTGGTAYLVMRYDVQPRVGSVFYDVELDELMAHSNVDKIIWIDGANLPDDPRSVTKLYWKKGDPKPAPEVGKCSSKGFNYCAWGGPGANTGYWEWL